MGLKDKDKLIIRMDYSRFIVLKNVITSEAPTIYNRRQVEHKRGCYNET